MHLDLAIKQLDDKMIRKFVLDTQNNVLHVFENPFPEDKDTHLKLAQDQAVDLRYAKGGRLKVENSKISYVGGSTTITTASRDEIDSFKGEVEIF